MCSAHAKNGARTIKGKRGRGGGNVNAIDSPALFIYTVRDSVNYHNYNFARKI